MRQMKNGANNDPEFIIFTGPMFGSKTTRLLAVVDRYRYQNKRVIAFKPLMDDRYSHTDISTHSGGSLSAVCVRSGDEIIENVSDRKEDFDVVAVDEAFMIKGSAPALLDIFRSGKTVVVSSLQLSATGNVFDEIKDMMPWATKIEVCPAVCPITGRDAYYTYRKFEDMNEITVGGAELYEPRCWEHHDFMNQRNHHGSG